MDVDYPVRCGSAEALPALWDADFTRAVLIGDHTTQRIFGDRYAAVLEGLGARPLRLDFPAGEPHKTRATKVALEDAMLAAAVDRHACIVALGGGVVLDLAGFVAATYMRGIAHIHVATTLLAQVDAAIGGKTAVNTAAGKNLIGAFHQPRAVLLDTDALATLPDDELRSGLAEAVKHAVLCDEELLGAIESWARARTSLRPPDAVVMRAAAIKAAIVAEDANERGRRYLLNFGHTVAHAIEHASDHAIAHGHAVAIGMVIEGRLCLPAAELTRLEQLLTALGLPIAAPCRFADAQRYLAVDKKNRAGVVRCALPERIGRCREGVWTQPVELAALERAWEGA